MRSSYFIRRTCLSAALTGVFFMSACTSETKTEGDADTAAVVSADTSTVNAAQTPESVLAEMPPVSELPALLELSGAVYTQTLLNKPEKAKNYTTTADKAALNLGVYATDVGYLCVYGKTQPAITYIRSSQALADHLGVTNAFQTETQKRFERNLSNRDSLTAIIDENMRSTQQFLNESDRKNTGALAVTGGFIEGLYISTGLVENYPKNVPANVRDQVMVSLVTTILKQKKPLADLITLLKSSGGDAQVGEYVTSLTELYQKFEAANFEEKLKNNQGNLLVNDKDLAGITAQVKQIRAKIVA